MALHGRALEPEGAFRRVGRYADALEIAATHQGLQVAVATLRALRVPVDVEIDLATGPELVTGATRLKAGTATKLVLNQITTVAFARTGKVYENLMVDVRASNAKLLDRATRMVATLAGLDTAAAGELLARADGHVKAAVVMHRHGDDLVSARARLDRCGGRLRAALESSSV